MYNHEKYYDHTAGIAVRRADKREKRARSFHLMYRIGELKCFQKLVMQRMSS